MEREITLPKPLYEANITLIPMTQQKKGIIGQSF
jgi:hypothetical protein